MCDRRDVISHVDLLADVIADALIAEHLSFNSDRGSKTVKAYYRWVFYRAWGLTANRGWVCSTAGASYKPRMPHGTKANTPVLETNMIKRTLTIVTLTPNQASSPARGTQ